MSGSPQKYAAVAITQETRRLIRHIANVTNRQMMEVVVSGVKLLQEKHQIPDPPVVLFQKEHQIPDPVTGKIPE